MAVEAFNHTSDVKAFVKGDGSAEERAYVIYNTIKHWGKAVESGKHGSTDTVPLWLTNEGLNTATKSHFQGAVRVFAPRE